MKTLKHLQNDDVKTIAVIGRTDDECRDIYEKLTKAGVAVNVIEAIKVNMKVVFQLYLYTWQKG